MGEKKRGKKKERKEEGDKKEKKGEEQGRIHGQYQSQTGGQGRKCASSLVLTDGPTNGRTDGQSLL